MFILDEWIRAKAYAVEDWLQDTRKALHRLPEKGFSEYKTQAFIVRTLREMGIECETHSTWVIAVIRGGRPGKTVALRADMDALPIEEDTGLDYASEHPGFMHACGHDLHMTVLLGAARLLMEMREKLCGTVKLFFQPSEEAVGGAKPMIDWGCMENPKVDYVYGLHVAPELPLGTVGTRAGTMYACTNTVNIVVHGISGHGASPNGGVDAIVCAAQLLTALQTLISRNIAPSDQAALHFGIIRGGYAHNIICDRVELTGTLRAADMALRDKLRARIFECAEGICAAMGTKAEVKVELDYPLLVNHASEAERVLRVASRLLGGENARTIEQPTMGGEDFAYFLQRAPGAFYSLGCTAPENMPSPPLHNHRFAPDMRCLPVGVMMQTALVWDILGEK